MAVPRMVADFYTQATLGRTGLEEFSRNLWPDMCQTCGSPLNEEVPVVVVTEFVEITASLHHRACQRPRWTKQPKDLDLRYVTTSARLISVPFGNPSRLPSFQHRYNATARPFDWTFTRHDLNHLLTRIGHHDRHATTTDSMINPTNSQARPLGCPS